jgi:hypothetical protein
MLNNYNLIVAQKKLIRLLVIQMINSSTTMYESKSP